MQFYLIGVFRIASRSGGGSWESEAGEVEKLIVMEWWPFSWSEGMEDDDAAPHLTLEDVH